ncbi:MAG: malate dehydrogenase [Bradyrhizobium sp.]
MKAFIIGSGTLGSTTGFLLAEHGLYDEIVLFDPFAPLAVNHSMDMLQAVCLTTNVAVRAGSLADMAGSDLVVMSAGIRSKASTPDFVGTAVEMAPLIGQIADALRTAPDAIVVTMTNPVDTLSYLLCRLSGLPEKQFLGFTWNDSLRFRWAIGKHFGVAPEQVEAYMVGEHGMSKLAVWSDVKVNGVKHAFSPEEREAVSAIQNGFWGEYMKVSDLRTAGWTTAYGALQQIRYVLGVNQGWCPCSVILGDYSAGQPAKLDRRGLVEAMPLHLAADEQALYDQSVAKIRGMIADIAKQAGWKI